MFHNVCAEITIGNCKVISNGAVGYISNGKNQFNKWHNKFSLRTF